MRPVRHAIVALAAIGAGIAAPAQADERVSITGDRDGSGQNFQWTIVNRHTAAITEVEFPHYHADTFTTPDGWTQECTNLEREGSKNLPGVCRGRTEKPQLGITPGGSASFGMRLARVGAERDRGTVTVKFADGSVQRVSGVWLPVAPSFLDMFLTPIAMGLLILAAFFVHWRRKRRGGAAGPAEPIEST